MRQAVGIALIIAGVVVFVIIVFAPGLGLASDKPGQLSNAGAILGMATFGMVPLVVLVGIGIYLLTQKDARR